jgi:hypothetical protein
MLSRFPSNNQGMAHVPLSTFRDLIVNADSPSETRIVQQFEHDSGNWIKVCAATPLLYNGSLLCQTDGDNPWIGQEIGIGRPESIGALRTRSIGYCAPSHHAQFAKAGKDLQR